MKKMTKKNWRKQFLNKQKRFVCNVYEFLSLIFIFQLPDHKHIQLMCRTFPKVNIEHLLSVFCRWTIHFDNMLSLSLSHDARSEYFK